MTSIIIDDEIKIGTHQIPFFVIIKAFFNVTKKDILNVK
jgi:hypothetical protein